MSERVKANKPDITKNERAYRTMLKVAVSYSVFLIVILILFGQLYYTAMDNSRDSYNYQAVSSMSGRIEQFEGTLKIMDTQCRQLLQEPDFRRIANQTEDNEAFLATGHSLSNMLAVNIYSDSLLPVKEIYYYFPKSGYVLGSSYFITQHHFYDWIKKYPAMLEDAWFATLMDEESYNTFFPFSEFQPNSGTNYYLYMINIDDLYFLDADVRAIFVIDRAKLYNMLGFNDNVPSYISIYDPKTERFILSADTTGSDITSIVTDLTYENDIARVRGKDLPSGMTLGRTVSDSTGFIFYYGFPTFDEKSAVGMQRIIYLAIGVALLLLGAMFVVTASRNNVRPILEISKELDESIEERNQLANLIDSQKPIIRRSYVRQLLVTGLSSEDEVHYIHEYLAIPDSECYFKAMQIVVYDSAETGEMVSTENEGIATEVLEFIVGFLENALKKPLHYFISGEHSLGVLVTCSEVEHTDYLLAVQNAIIHLHDEMLDKYSLWLFAGIGKTTQTLMNVWESYEQANEAVTYTSKNYIFLPYEYIKKDSKSFYYPPEFSAKLNHFVTNGNKTQAMELLRLIHKENLVERSLPVNVLQFLLTDIRNTLIKARFELPTGTDETALKDLDEKFEEKLSFRTCETIASELADLFAEKNADGNLIDSIVTYIKENYADSLLCLNKISDEFSISETYFSHLFKQKTGENFSSFLENIRMKKAMELIKGGDVPLTDVYALVGYNNQNSFRRAFKKVYGTTPGSINKN